MLKPVAPPASSAFEPNSVIWALLLPVKSIESITTAYVVDGESWMPLPGAVKVIVRADSNVCEEVGRFRVPMMVPGSPLDAFRMETLRRGLFFLKRSSNSLLRNTISTLLTV